MATTVSAHAVSAVTCHNLGMHSASTSFAPCPSSANGPATRRPRICSASLYWRDSTQSATDLVWPATQGDARGCVVGIKCSVFNVCTVHTKKGKQESWHNNYGAFSIRFDAQVLRQSCCYSRKFFCGVHRRSRINRHSQAKRWDDILLQTLETTAMRGRKGK